VNEKEETPQKTHTIYQKGTTTTVEKSQIFGNSLLVKFSVRPDPGQPWSKRKWRTWP